MSPPSDDIKNALQELEKDLDRLRARRPEAPPPAPEALLAPAPAAKRAPAMRFAVPAVCAIVGVAGIALARKELLEAALLILVINSLYLLASGKEDSSVAALEQRLAALERRLESGAGGGNLDEDVQEIRLIVKSLLRAASAPSDPTKPRPGETTK
ncbi:MAG TPA: hypothetical protein VNI01_09105 [Elusimicrobiota bacterium]|nr:hypothetical protein [Elusimicrobiota bacterium]